MANQFIVTTVACGASFCLNAFVLCAFYFSRDSLKRTGVDLFLNFSDTLTFLVWGVHVILLYTRSKVVFRGSTSFVKFIYVIAAITFLCGFLSVLSGILISVYVLSLDLTTLFYFQEAVTISSAVGLIVIDVVLTACFIQYVFGIHRSFGDGSVVLHMKQTLLIAERSAFICAVAILAFVVDSIYWILATYESPMVRWAYLAYQCVLFCVVRLWMELKIKLDSIAQEHETRRLKEHHHETSDADAGDAGSTVAQE
eukprot:TRINITY_DN10150_c0_g1_i1.p1 TRINITY_DN10150_c0_g1~~TRINITY_DN10150_c0_g1_i1.p1  ORF type:complete len:296 (+),score=55.93 TRINITY_DN10150_c0_g1_i1:124-888(+)